MTETEIGKRLKEKREQIGLSLQDVANYLDVNRSSVMRWENGETNKIKLPIIEKLAQILNTTPEYLIGYEDSNSWLSKNAIAANNLSYLPVIGKVCAGNGLLAEENIIKYEIADSKFERDNFFYLTVSGDSMSPKLDDGDLVLVRKQTSVDSGDVGVFLVDGNDGVVKKVKYSTDYIELHSFNPYYPVLRFEKNEILRVRVIGKVIESKRRW